MIATPGALRASARARSSADTRARTSSAYGPDGEARDPMAWLVSWLRTAERGVDVGRLLQAHRPAVEGPRRAAWPALPAAVHCDVLAKARGLELLWLLRAYPDVGVLGAAEYLLELALSERPPPAPPTDRPGQMLDYVLGIATPEHALRPLATDNAYFRTRTRTLQLSRKPRTSSQPS
jgi:hypothetical protein